MRKSSIHSKDWKATRMPGLQNLEESGEKWGWKGKQESKSGKTLEAMQRIMILYRKNDIELVKGNYIINIYFFKDHSGCSREERSR